MAWVKDIICCHSNKIHNGYNTEIFNITIDRFYKVIDCLDNDGNKIIGQKAFVKYYLILDDLNTISTIPSNLFHDITVEEFREMQINQILK